MEGCTQLRGKFFPEEVIHITSLSILFDVIGMCGSIASIVSLALQIHDCRKNNEKKSEPSATPDDSQVEG